MKRHVSHVDVVAVLLVRFRRVPLLQEVHNKKDSLHTQSWHVVILICTCFVPYQI